MPWPLVVLLEYFKETGEIMWQVLLRMRYMQIFDKYVFISAYHKAVSLFGIIRR